MQTGDTTADISRMFIYYVGRKKDQMSFPRGGSWSCLLWAASAVTPVRRAAQDTSIQPKDEGMTLGGAISALELKLVSFRLGWYAPQTKT